MIASRVLCLVACIYCGLPSATQGQTSQPAPTGEVIQGTRTDTALSAGKWQAYFNAHGSQFAAANDKAIWFQKAGNLWRYDIAKKAIDVCTTPMTLAETASFACCSLADDGRLAASCTAATFLWTPGEGWSRLPLPEGYTNWFRPAFDASGRLWAATFNKAFAWTDGMWGQPIDIPEQNGGLHPVGDGWFMKGKEPPGYRFWSASLDSNQPYPAERQDGDFRRVLVRVKKESFAQFGPFGYGPISIARITPKTIERLIEAQYVGVNLSSGEVFKLVPRTDGTTAEVQAADGKKLTAFPLPPGLGQEAALLLRDGNGHYWSGHYRWDGTRWQAMIPPMAFDYAGDMRLALKQGRLTLDHAKQTWIDAWPEIPVNVVAYDPKTRTGWLRRDKPSAREATWDLFEFAADGTKKLLKSVKPITRQFSLPEPGFLDGAGDWWFGTIMRWDGKAAHAYDDGWAGRRSSEEGLPQMLRSASSNIWMYHTSRQWKKYDRQADKFVDAEPYGDFAFKFRDGSFAIVAEPMDTGWDWNSHLGMIYWKRTPDSAWQPMPNPFVAENYVTRGQTSGRATLYGYPGKLIRGDRMLVSCYLGVFEWDARQDRWAYLLPFGGMWAYFDDSGRRIMVSSNHGGLIIVFDGDPLAKLDSPASQQSWDAQVDDLLKKMDNDSWRLRKKATEELVNLLRKNPQVIPYLKIRLKSGQLSLEVATRLESILPIEEKSMPDLSKLSHEEAQLAWVRIAGNSLFERMRQPMTPQFPGGYVIKPGMQYDLAKSIFQAAGAKYSGAIHNKHYPDLSCQGYLLPDNTMVYLRVEEKTAKGKIVSVGLGPAGKGVDEKWDFEDPQKNSTKTLELKPNTAKLAD